jgi:hypothetical protein
MHRWLRIAAVLCVAAVTPLVAQQASSPAPSAAARTTQAGPRLQPEFRSVQPAFSNRSASAAPVSDTHTIRMTTVVLVLVVVVLVLLIAK